MVVKPMSLLSKSAGHGDRVPTSLVVNGTWYSSVKKSRSLKSRSPERGAVAAVPNVKRNLHTSELCAKDVRGRFEKPALDDSIRRDISHPSLHSPEMLSTKGHDNSVDELSSLRNRLVSRRGPTEVHGNSNMHHTLEDHGQKNSSRDIDQNGNITKNGDMVSSGFGNEQRKSRSVDRVSRSRIKVLHVSDAHSNGSRQCREDAVKMEKLKGGSILDVEKLANGNMCIHGNKERPSRSRHRDRPSTMELLTNGDVQMMYETDSRSMQGLDTALSQYKDDKMMSNEIAGKGGWTPTRIHYHRSLQKSPHNRIEDRTTIVKVSEINNVRVSDSSGSDAISSSAAIDDLNRIHQRVQQSSVVRDSPRSNAVVAELDARSSLNIKHDVREDGLRHRRHPNPSVAAQSLPLNHDIRQDVSRGLSHWSSMQSSGDRSPNSYQTHRNNHPPTYERDNHSAESQPPSARSARRQTARVSKQNSGNHLSSYRSSYQQDDPQNSLNHLIPGEHSNRGLCQRGPKVGQTWFAATELQSNLLVEVADFRFHLHKFPLFSRSGRLNRMVFESRDANKDHIKLPQMPGGAEAFELAVKFCYGIHVELTPLNVATLRCAAEYLEMTDSLEDENLVFKTEHYLNFVILASWKNSIAVLQSCQRLLPWAEETQIVRRCSESVAWKACTDQHGVTWSSTSTSNVATVMWDGGKQTHMAQHIPHDWWLEDVFQLNFDAFGKVMSAIGAKGMAYTLVGSAIAQYASRWIPGVERKNRKHQDVNRNISTSHEPGRSTHFTGEEVVVRDAHNQAHSLDHDENRALVEGVTAILPPQQDGVSCSFLLRLLRAACVFGANAVCREELERRVGLQLEHASVNDLLIPSQISSQTMYDLDVVQRILEQFLLKDETGATSPLLSIKNVRQLHVFESGVSKPQTAPNMTKSKVAKLMDAYLAEVARDTNLSLARFQNLAESLPEFSRATDDGLYRAVDTYLKAHPTMTEHERKKLCRVMDCQRLSLEACLHAAQNERLPLRVVVQVLFSEQVKLRNAITANSLTKTRDYHSTSSAYSSAQKHSQPGGQSVVPRLDNSDADVLSLHESWLAACEDIKCLKQEMERIKAKYTDFQHYYYGITQQVEKMSKPKVRTPSGWTSGWRRLSSTLKPPSIFQTSRHEFDYNQKDDESIAPTNASGEFHDQSYTLRATADLRRRSHS